MSREMFLATLSGRRVNPHTLLSSDVTVQDIAWPLARQCRFNGHVSDFYSVAAHSLHVAELVPPALRAYGLLHDAHEAYMGDLITPMKAALGQGLMAEWRRIEALVDAAIHGHFGLRWPLNEDAQAAIKLADLQALAMEKVMFINDPVPWPGLPPLKGLTAMPPNGDWWDIGQRFEAELMALTQAGAGHSPHPVSPAPAGETTLSHLGAGEGNQGGQP